MMRKLIALFTALVMLLSISAVALAEEGAVPEGRRKVTFWHCMSGGLLDATEAIVADFNNSQDEIWVEPSYQGAYDECLTKLRSAFTASSAPDVFMMFELGANYLANSGYIIPFQDRFDEDPFMDLDDIVDVLRNYYTINGKLQCFPFNPSSQLLYYNVDAFEAAGVEVPTTLEGVADVADALVATGKVKYALAMPIYGWSFENLVAGMGGYYLNNENGRSGVATAIEYTESGVGEKIMKTWKDLVDKGYIYNYGTSNADARSGFIAGDCAMVMYSTGAMRTIERTSEFTVGAHYLPVMTEGAETAVLIGGANMWMYKSGDKQREDDAWKFVRFYAENAEETAKFSIASGYFAVRKSAYDLDFYAQYLEENPNSKVAVQQLLDSPINLVTAGANTGCMTELRQIWQNTFAKYLGNEITLEEAMDEMRTLSNEAIEYYNEVNGLVD